VKNLVMRVRDAGIHLAYDPTEPAGKTIAGIFEAIAEETSAAADHHLRISHGRLSVVETEGRRAGLGPSGSKSSRERWRSLTASANSTIPKINGAVLKDS